MHADSTRCEHACKETREQMRTRCRTRPLSRSETRVHAPGALAVARREAQSVVEQRDREPGGTDER
eukprot:1799873-Pleurochrysis_carterae.AAC.1